MVIKNTLVADDKRTEYLEVVGRLLQQMLQQMVEEAYHPHVTIIENDRTMIFKVDCPPECLGQILGSKGRNITSVRTLITAMCSRRGIRAIVDVPYYKPNKVLE